MSSGSSVEMATKKDTFPDISLPLQGPSILPIKSLSGDKLLGILQQDWSKKNAPAFPGHFLFPGASVPPQQAGGRQRIVVIAVRHQPTQPWLLSPKQEQRLRICHRQGS
jgi:hypothetical protein